MVSSSPSSSSGSSTKQRSLNSRKAPRRMQRTDLVVESSLNKNWSETFSWGRARLPNLRKCQTRIPRTTCWHRTRWRSGPWPGTWCRPSDPSAAPRHQPDRQLALIKAVLHDWQLRYLIFDDMIWYLKYEIKFFSSNWMGREVATLSSRKKIFLWLT